MTKEFKISERDMRGLALRLAMLQTNYRKPKDFKVSELNAAAKTLRRWLSIAWPGRIGPALGVLEALVDDLNTPQAIAVMHKLAAEKRGDELFGSMLLLGLVPGEGRVIDYDIVSGVKTLPIDSIPFVQWNAFAHEFPTKGQA